MNHKFTHLHVHTHYSLLDGLSKIPELLDYAKEQGMDSIAITDHGNMYGVVEFYKEAKKRGIKPIIGSEMYLAYETINDRRPNIDDKQYHLVLLVRDKKGYENLVQLTTKAWLLGFYYKPRIDKNLLKEHNQGLIALSACLKGEIPQAILNNDFKKAERLALEYQDIFGKGNFYLELQHHPGIPGQEIVNKALIEISKKHKIPLIATNDCHYLRPSDAEAQDILMAINTDRKTDDPERLTMRKDDFSVRPIEKMVEDFKNVPEAIVNTQEIVNKCNFEFELGKTQLPDFKLPNGKNADDYLRELVYNGFKTKYKESLRKKAKDRIEYELSVIKQTGFAPYFLIVADFVNWAKRNGIVVGPGRGSAAGSIVSYLLNITEIDPLKYNLLFERFLNPERISMPDIDIDFADNRRDEVIKYVTEKYGENHVAQIITFGTMAARAVVRDVGRAMNYPYNLCDQIAKMIPFGMNLETALHESQELHHLYHTDEEVKKLIDTGMKLEGVVRHASTHAAGVVITKEDINKVIPRQHPTQNENTIVTQYEMHSIEDLGLLKIDFLGLKTLTVIENVVNKVKERHNKEIEIQKIPLDDKKTYDLLSKGDTTGVFQLESEGMKRYLKELKPSEFEDIIAMVALYRPGPMNLIPEYIARKHNRKQIEYLHPKLEPILKNTYGICVYQEQLMQIAQKLAGFSLAEADILRKAVGKKIKKLLEEQREKMINGMINNGISKNTAEKIWEWIEPFARYGFNRSHSCCYATIAYWTAFLKAYYPLEFMASLMTSEQDDVERIAFLINECKKMKIQVLPPDINESDGDFTVVGNQIRFGLNAIKNVGHNIVEAIVKERKNYGKFTSVCNFIERVQSKDLNKKSLEALIKAGALDCLEERNKLLFNLEKLLNYARDVQKRKMDRQFSLFDLSIDVGIKLEEVPPADKKEYLLWEKELLGLYISEHPTYRYYDYLKKLSIPCKKVSSKYTGRRVRIGGIINKITKINTRTGKPMLFVEVEDFTDKVEVVVFPDILEKTATSWQEDKIVLVRGKVNDRGGRLSILCDDVKVIE